MGDLGGRTVLVTGASSGIGRATATALAARGATVVLACRNLERTRPVADAIEAEAGAGAVRIVPLDLADLASVRRGAQAFLALDLPLDVLVANAGVAGLRGATAEGFELAFGTNHLGHFLLTTLLLERLRASAPARVVVVASDAHLQATGIDYDAVCRPTRSFTAMGEYAVSKLANVAFAQELARRETGHGVASFSVHPGVIASDIWKRVPWPVRPVVTRFMRSPAEGARTSVHCATAPGLEADSGGYFSDCRLDVPSPVATPALGAELWERSEELVSGRMRDQHRGSR